MDLLLIAGLAFLALVVFLIGLAVEIHKIRRILEERERRDSELRDTFK